MKSETEITGDNAIEIRELRKAFGSNQILDGATLELHKGENLVVLGKSGSGKSVLIKCVVRLLNADSGEILVLGENINTLKGEPLDELRRKIGFLFQSAALYDSMTVRKNLEFPLRRMKEKLSDADITKKVEEALENVGLPDAIDKMPSELSGGMRKRIGLARTIIVDPEILLYDEPTTGLDPVTSLEISNLINDIQEKYKTSSIVITHDIECVRTVADRIVMLKDGKVYMAGTLDEFENSQDEVIKAYFESNKNKNKK